MPDSNIYTIDKENSSQTNSGKKKKKKVRPDLSPEAMPQVGDVVLCYFPTNESGDEPGLKLRPGLVVNSMKDLLGEPCLAVAYGTSKRMGLDRLWPGDCPIVGVQALEERGLNHPTKFCLDRVKIIPWKSKYFSWGKEGQCVIGSMPKKMMEYINEKMVRQSHKEILPNITIKKEVFNFNTRASRAKFNETLSISNDNSRTRHDDKK